MSADVKSITLWKAYCSDKAKYIHFSTEIKHGANTVNYMNTLTEIVFGFKTKY